jgi:hypothetical protein
MRSVQAIGALVVVALMAACAHQAPVAQLRLLNRIFTNVQTASQPLFDDLAAAERRQGQEVAMSRARPQVEVPAVRVLGRGAQLDLRARGQEVTIYETLQGLEVKRQEGCWYLFPDYRLFRQFKFTAPWNMPTSFSFERQQSYCPRIAVA